MAANSNPKFTKNGRVSSVLVTAANTNSQGGGTVATDIFLAFSADAANGSFVERVRLIPTATVPTTTLATVARIFVSTVAAGATTSANTYLVGEITLPAISADSGGTAVIPFDVPLGFALPASNTILITNHAAPLANSAWRAVVIGGDY